MLLSRIGRSGWWLLALSGGLALLPFVGDEYVLRLGSRILIYALACASLDLILGYGGLVSFGHAAFFGIGVYTVGLLANAGFQSALLAWPLAVVAGAALGSVIGAIVLRTKNLYFIMITLAFGQMLFYLFSALKHTGGSDGQAIPSRNALPGIDLTDPATFYWVILALTVVSFLALWVIVHSPFGMTIRACKENERRVGSLGLSVYKYQLIAFTIASGFAGLAGALNANLTLYMSPASFSWHLSGDFIIILILGGVGTLVGAFVGSASLLLLEEVASIYTTHWRIVQAVVLLLVVLFARRGLYGLIFRR